MDNETATRIKNLEMQILNIATRLGDNSNRNESKIIETDTHVSEVAAINGTAWSPNKTYSEGEYVVYGSSIARCKFLNVGVEPSNSTYWELKTIAEVLVELANKIKESE